MKTMVLSIIAAAATLALSACEPAPAPDAGVGAGAETAGAAGADARAGAVDPQSLEYFNVSVGDRVLFATDSSRLDPSAREVLGRQAEWLEQNPSYAVTIEGHADERGTREYNLALGARRAEAARLFLVGRGVTPGRIETVTYGKERPAAACSAPRCWAENRRAVTVLAGAPAA